MTHHEYQEPLHFLVAAAPSALYVVKKAERENLRIFPLCK